MIYPNNPLIRHSRAGGNPAKTNTPRSGQNRDVVLLSACAWRAVPIPFRIILYILALTITPPASAGELGRLFFTPEQRAQLNYSYEQGARPDSGASGRSGALTLNGIVQMHGGKRTVWINGVPQAVGSSDEKAPESMPVPLPGQNKSIKLKVGQRILLRPSASPETSTPSSPKPVPAKPVAEDDD